MLATLRNIQTLLALAIIAISFFIQYGFFIKHFVYTPELYILSTILLTGTSFMLFALKLQPLIFINKNAPLVEQKELINPKGRSRIRLYDMLSITFKISLLITSIKFFGFAFHVTWAFATLIVLDILFMVVYGKKYCNAWINNTLILFNSRTEIISFQNVKNIEKRYNDFYITYTSGKVKLLKSDLISDEMNSRVSVFS